MTPTAQTARPRAEEHAPYFAKYIELVTAPDVLGALERQGEETPAALLSLAPEMAGHRYAEGKWTIAQLVGHVIDTERVLAYRALRIARGDPTPLASFDQDLYVSNGAFELRTLSDLVDEYRHVRAATLDLFRHLTAEGWERRGTSNNHTISVRAIAWIIAGHERHHGIILRERYLAP